MAETNIDLIRGDTYQGTLTVKDAAGAALDLTGWAFEGQCRNDPDDATTLGSFSFDTSQLASGIVGYTLATGVTTGFINKYVYYDIQGTSGAGVVRTFVYGRFLVIKDTTPI